jgi:chloride channel protein, CIC family
MRVGDARSQVTSWFGRTADTVGRRMRSRTGLLVVLAALVGVVTGLLAVALITLVGFVQRISFGTDPVGWVIVVVPSVGGLLVGLLVWRLVPEARGSGISEVMAAIALRGGDIRTRVIGGKFLASTIGLGTGASGGREGPIVQIGSAVGSRLGRLAELPEDQIRSLIAAGAAGGIAASFNAPIGGMLFALEVIIGGFGLRHLQTVVVSAVVASVTARQLIGEDLIYSPPAYALGDPWELGLYALLGLLAVAVGVAFIRAARAAELLAGRVPLPLRTALGGLAVGMIALAVPEVLGSGEHLPDIEGAIGQPIQAMLEGGLAPTFLLVLLAAKLVATVASISTGNAVGSFQPLIFVGAALGGAFGHAASLFLPGIQPGAFALVGTAAVVAAAGRAPLTGVLLVFELTGSYDMVLPLMLATGVATVVADRIQPASLYTEPLERRGIAYEAGEEVDVMQSVTVGEVMTRNPDCVPSDLSVPEVRAWFRRTRHHGAPVVEQTANGTRLLGIVTISDLAIADDPDVTGDLAAPRGGELTAADICTRDPVTVTGSAPVYRAVQRMAALDVGRLPVVDEYRGEYLVGLVRRADVVKAYQRALARGVSAQQHRATTRLRDLRGVRFLEIVIKAGAPADGRPVREVPWPVGTVLTSVRRGGDLIVPRGDTVLRRGDEVVALVSDTAARETTELLSGDGS